MASTGLGGGGGVTIEAILYQSAGMPRVCHAASTLSLSLDTGDDLQFKIRQMDGWMDGLSVCMYVCMCICIYVYLYIHPPIYLSISRRKKKEMKEPKVYNEEEERKKAGRNSRGVGIWQKLSSDGRKEGTAELCETFG